MVDGRIKEELQNKAEEVTEGSVQNGDVVTINYVGTKDGVAFDGGTANNYELTIGSGTFIDGFEDGIIWNEKKARQKISILHSRKSIHLKSWQDRKLYSKLPCRASNVHRSLPMTGQLRIQTAKPQKNTEKRSAPHWRMRQKQAHRIHSVRLHGIQYFLLPK